MALAPNAYSGGASAVTMNRWMNVFARTAAARRVPAELRVRLLLLALALAQLAWIAESLASTESGGVLFPALSAFLTGAVGWRVVALFHKVEEDRARTERSEQRFRMVFDSAGVGISVGSDGMLTETNAAYQRMLGYSGEELSRMHYHDITHPDDIGLDLAATREVMSGKRGSFRFEKRLVRSDGETLCAEVTVTRAADGSFGIALIEDITARKQLEDELREAQKLEAVGRLAGGIAHDFNNLLTVVSGYGRLMLGEAAAAADPSQRERLEAILAAADRAADLTRQLLAFSRRQVLQAERLDLGRVVAKHEDVFRRLIPADVVLALSVEHGAVVLADRAQLEEVLLNLVLNARDALPHGGRIDIRRRRRRRLGGARCRRRRHRSHPGGAGARLRALLHDEAVRRGRRTRARHGARNRRAERRHDRGGERAAAGDHVHGAAAARRCARPRDRDLGGPGGGEPAARLGEVLGDHLHVREHRHEVRVAAPARHDVQVPVVDDPGAGDVADVPADVVALRPVDRGERG